MSTRGHKPTKRGTTAPGKPKNDYSDDDPTSIYDSGEQKRGGQPAPPAQSPAGSASNKPRPQTGPIIAVSMKTPADPKLAVVEKPKVEREMPHVKLRAMSEVARAQQPQNLGNLAPPYDPSEARARTLRDYIVWGSLAIVIASGIALAVWFIAT